METRTCKHCNEPKLSTYSHLGKHQGKVYKDETGRLWKGQVCPDCQAKIRKEQRAAKKQANMLK